MILGARPIFYKMRTQAVAENGDFVLKSYGEIIWESTRDGDVRALQAMSGARRVPLSRYKIRRRWRTLGNVTCFKPSFLLVALPYGPSLLPENPGFR